MMISYSQEFIENRYQQWAKVYDQLTPMYLLGSERHLRTSTLGALQLQPGQTVLDVACGTGRNFPFILDQIGPEGRLVGVDYSADMLRRAQATIERSGWKNVTLIQVDAAQMDLNLTFDATLCTLAMGVIPNYRAALKQMIRHLKPGGRLAVGDARLSSRWYGRYANWLAYLLGYGAAEVMTRQPWRILRTILCDYQYEDWAWGFFYVAAGNVQKPRELQTSR